MLLARLLRVSRAHSIFTDRPGPAGVELNSVVKRATRELSGIFLKSVLADAPGKSVADWLTRRKHYLIVPAAQFVAAEVSPSEHTAFG